MRGPAARRRASWIARQLRPVDQLAQRRESLCFELETNPIGRLKIVTTLLRVRMTGYQFPLKAWSSAASGLAFQSS